MIWTGERPPILASQSKSRQNLLKNAGLGFESIPADIDERQIHARSILTDPSSVAAMLAIAKANHVSAHHPARIVIGADQTLALGARLFNKPANAAKAAEQLHELSGATHELHSAVAVVDSGKLLFSHVSTARLTMRTLGEQSIRRYLDAAGDAVISSVGAYQLEALGIHLFERIEGDHFTILGLPLMPLLDFFRSRGLLAI